MSAVALSKELGEKKGVYYQDMRFASYPLLVGAALDLANIGQDVSFSPNHARYRQIPFVHHPGPSSRNIPVAGLELFFRTNLSGIPSVRHRNANRFDIYYPNLAKVPQPSFDLGAINYLRGEDTDFLSFHINSFYRLFSALTGIWNHPDSYASAINRLLGQISPDLNSKYVLTLAKTNTIDGYNSTFVAAVNLSQTPVPGSKTPRERLTQVLSSRATTELAKLARVGTPTALGEIGIYPKRSLELGKEGIQMTRNAKRFIQIANKVFQKYYLRKEVPQPLICPIAVPLGSEGVDRTIDFYQNQLPQEVQDLLEENADVPGIEIASRAIARFLN